MPVKSVELSQDECCKAAVPIILPIGITGLGWYVYNQKRDQKEWFDKLKKPNWVMSCPVRKAVFDFGVIVPVGYAAALALKEARGDDQQLALSLYGAGLLSYAAAIPTFAYTKNLKLWFGISALTTGLFGATAFVFYKIHNTAGLLLVPLTAWLAYGTFGLLGTIQENPGPF